MDFITKIARGIAAVQATVGSDELGPQQPLALEAGGTLNLQARRKRETSQRIMRLETPLGEGLARIDLSAADARALAEALTAFANSVADDAKPVPALPKTHE
ncbi:MAG: hypothetical protein NT037_15550 [Hyphomicrobiales bacterium]|jgi:hypothetical protein|nr:hypothetical protein [Hyphomicrobiales bacterium]